MEQQQNSHSSASSYAVRLAPCPGGSSLWLLNYLDPLEKLAAATHISMEFIVYAFFTENTFEAAESVDAETAPYLMKNILFYIYLGKV